MALVLVAGIVKFNIIQDDIYIAQPDGTVIQANKLEKLTGAWVEPIPGMEDQQQGFLLQNDGIAASVNMATLRYTAWRYLEPDTIELDVISIGNGSFSKDVETLTIISLTDDTLVVDRSGVEVTFTKQTVELDNDLYFDPVDKLWRDNFGVCHTCTPENGFGEDGQEFDPGATNSMHPSWDIDNDGINDCETEGTCDDSVDYSQPKPTTLNNNETATGGLSVTGVFWKLVEMDDVAITVAKAPTVTFTEEFIEGFSGCNNYRASYDRSGDTLTVQPGMQTLMACDPQKIMDLEHTFVDHMTNVTSYTVTDESLILNGRGFSTLVFVPVSSQVTVRA